MGGGYPLVNGYCPGVEVPEHSFDLFLSGCFKKNIFMRMTFYLPGCFKKNIFMRMHHVMVYDQIDCTKFSG